MTSSPEKNAAADSRSSPVFLPALGAGAAIASLYYTQPLLADIGAEFHASAREAGAVTVASQIGYAAGLLILVPLGDVVERRGLIACCMFSSAVMLLAASTSASLGALIAWSALLGFVSVSPQMLVPFAATLASPQKRGRAVGMVTAGLLAGIITGRFAGGTLGGTLGWRGLYAISGAGLLLVAFALLRGLPVQRAPQPVRLRELPRSLARLLAGQTLLRRHLLMGAAGFATFSVFWTTLSFFLRERSGSSGAATAGALGLLGIVGVIVAPLAGRLADRVSARRLNGAALLILAMAFFPILGATLSLVWLTVGAALLEVGVQCNLVSSQSRLQALVPESRNRVNALYMAGYFAGGAAGSALGPWCLTRFGWAGLCAMGAALAIAGWLARPGADAPPRERSLSKTT